jgi:hypothetical protein
MPGEWSDYPYDPPVVRHYLGGGAGNPAAVVGI